MKLLSTAAAVLLSVAPFAVTARSIDFFNSQSPISTNGIPVKGDNPLEYCANPSGDVLEIKKVDLSPNPPLPYVLLRYSRLSFRDIHR